MTSLQVTDRRPSYRPTPILIGAAVRFNGPPSLSLEVVRPRPLVDGASTSSDVAKQDPTESEVRGIGHQSGVPYGPNYGVGGVG